MSDDIVVNMNFNLGKGQTVADIVTLLRKYQPYSELHGQAADEIERLRAEVNTMACAQDGWGQLGRVKAENERLREVGDKLAMHLDAFFGMLEPASNEIAQVIEQWKEARRG